jgi:chromosome segregation ATPase
VLILALPITVVGSNFSQVVEMYEADKQALKETGIADLDGDGVINGLELREFLLAKRKINALRLDIQTHPEALMSRFDVHKKGHLYPHEFMQLQEYVIEVADPLEMTKRLVTASEENDKRLADMKDSLRQVDARFEAGMAKMARFEAGMANMERMLLTIAAQLEKSSSHSTGSLRAQSDDAMHATPSERAQGEIKVSELHRHLAAMRIELDRRSAEALRREATLQKSRDELAAHAAQSERAAAARDDESARFKRLEAERARLNEALVEGAGAAQQAALRDEANALQGECAALKAELHGAELGRRSSLEEADRLRRRVEEAESRMEASVAELRALRLESGESHAHTGKLVEVQAHAVTSRKQAKLPFGTIGIHNLPNLLEMSMEIGKDLYAVKPGYILDISV